MTSIPSDSEQSNVLLRKGLTRRSLVAGVTVGAWASFERRASAQVSVTGRRIFLSPTGDDGNPGSEEKPLATFKAVFERFPKLGAGDRIIAMPGIYREAVVVKAGGNETENLVIVSQVRHAAQIRSPKTSYSAVAIEKSFVTIDGFDVQGEGTGHGIEATFLDGDNRNNGPHHIVILNNVSHDNAGSGISVAYGDVYRIENNICYGNCATNKYQGSGISIYEARAVPAKEDLRIIVARNTCFDNMAIKLPGDVPHSDGNGIIIDDLRNTQKPNPSGSYPYKTLVENNLCYRNGGKGVHVFLSDNVVVRNNTCCYNNRDPKNPAAWRGELSNVNSSNIVWVNNIGVADTTQNSRNAAILDASTGVPRNVNVIWKHNVTFNGKKGYVSVTQSPSNPSLVAAAPFDNLFGVDPLFVRGGVAEASPDFHLLPGSPARNAGTDELGLSSVDREGSPRMSGSAPDLGAFEGSA